MMSCFSTSATVLPIRLSSVLVSLVSFIGPVLFIRGAGAPAEAAAEAKGDTGDGGFLSVPSKLSPVSIIAESSIVSPLAKSTAR